MEPSVTLMQVIERFGFPVAVSAALALFIWVIGRQIVAELGRLTRAVTLVVLAMQFAPEFHEEARRVHAESMSAARKRKEDLESETNRREPR